MKIELRVSDINRIDSAISTNCDVIGLGNEGCFAKLPDLSAIQSVRDKALSAGKEFSIVTPKTPQRNFKATMDYIHSIKKIDNDIPITVNDYGVLASLKGEYPNIFLGRMVIFTIEECPWYYSMIRDEEAEDQQISLQLNIKHSYKMKIFKQLNLTGVEVNLMPETMENSYPYILENGLKINAHYGFTSIALTRSCHIRRFFDAQNIPCQNLCDEYVVLSLKEIYQIVYAEKQNRNLFEDGWMEFREPNEKTKNNISDFYMSGNIVMRKVTELDNNKVRFDWLNKIIIDQRSLKTNELIDTIDNLKSLSAVAR